MMEKETAENMVHRLKLQWIMAKDDAERRRISEEIIKRTGVKLAVKGSAR